MKNLTKIEGVHQRDISIINSKLVKKKNYRKLPFFPWLGTSVYDSIANINLHQ